MDEPARRLWTLDEFLAAEMGLSVPRDLSLIAWDDSQLCQLTHPNLSAMSHDVFGFGADVTRRRTQAEPA